jgi:putative peptidoglycan lipid II flippase
MTDHGRRIARFTAVVAGATLLSRLLGFLRDLVVAFALGAGPMADAFFVAFRLPNLMRRLFAEGSLTMAFIPVFSRIRAEEGEERANSFARSSLVWLLLVLGVLTVAVLALAEPVVRAVAPGFAEHPELLHNTAHLVRICFPYVMLICSVALCMGILNAKDHFLAPALAPCALNVALISAALGGFLSGSSVPVWMSWGVLVGGLLQWLMQQPALHRRAFYWRGPWRFFDPGVWRMARLMGPTVFGAAVYQVNILLGTLLASFLPLGSISYLYYADRLVQFPLGVFGLAVSTAALPSLAKLAAKGREEEFSSTLRTAMGLTLFISLPAAAGLLALSQPIIDLLFGRGAFTAEAVAGASAALVAYAVGLPFVAAVRPLVSSFYALEDTKTPVMVAAGCMVLNVGLGALLMQSMAHVGLALAVSVSGAANALLLGRLLARRTGKAPIQLRPLLLSTALSLVVGLLAWASSLVPWLWIAAAPILAVSYLFTARALRMEEASLVFEMFRRRLKTKKTAADG